MLNAVTLALSFILVSTAVGAQELQRQKFLSNGFSTKGGKVKVAFFDADSTLRVSRSGSVSANSPTDVVILPWVSEKIAEVSRAGYLIMIVSNQAGVEFGHVTMETADQALQYTIQLIQDANKAAKIHYYDFAEKSDNNRKPGTGMAARLEEVLKAKKLKVDWAASYMVGDSAYKKGKDTKPDGTPGVHFSNADRLFAENLKIPFYEPTDFFGWRSYGIDVFHKASEVEEFLARHGKK